MMYSASLIVHWPTGPVNCCEEHADKLIALAKFMGYHVGTTEAQPDSECTNCKNEAPKK